MLLNSSSELGRLDATHLGMWLNFDAVRREADPSLTHLVAEAAGLAYSDDHKKFVNATGDMAKRQALISLFTTFAHEARHFHDLVITPYGSILMNHYVRAALSVLSSQRSLFSSPAVIVPLAEWPSLLPLLGKIDPGLQQPNPKLTELIATFGEIEGELKELDRGVLYPDASFSATSILESSAILIQIGLAGQIFGLEASNQLMNGIRQSAASSRYFGALEFLMGQLGSLPFGAWTLLLLASLCGDVYNGDKRALRSPVDVLITITRWLAKLDGFPVTRPVQSRTAAFDLIAQLYDLINQFFHREFGADLIDQLGLGAINNAANVEVWEQRIKGKSDSSLQWQRVLQTLDVYRNFSEISARLVSNFATDPAWYLIDQYLDRLPYLPQPLIYLWSDYGWPADPSLQKDFYIQQEVIVPLPEHMPTEGPAAEAFSGLEELAYNDGTALRLALVISPKQSQMLTPPHGMFSNELAATNVATWRGYFDAVVPMMRLLLNGPETGLPGEVKMQAFSLFDMFGTKVYSRSGLLKPPKNASIQEMMRWDTRYPNWPNID
jgi:hypothetical protein